MLTFGAGLFAAGALIFTARNFTLSRRTFQLTEQGQVTERYTRAIEQLGSERLDVRIGGIYALERIARDSARDHPTVMEVLTSFVREHSVEEWPPPSRDVGPRQPMRPDVQAAMTVIGRRNVGYDRQPINLTDAHLERVELAGANLANVDFYSANLEGAWLVGANLIGANFVAANLTNAIIYDAKFDSGLGRAELTGVEWPDDAPVPDGLRVNSAGHLESTWMPPPLES